MQCWNYFNSNTNKQDTHNVDNTDLNRIKRKKTIIAYVWKTCLLKNSCNNECWRNRLDTSIKHCGIIRYDIKVWCILYTGKKRGKIRATLKVIIYVSLLRPKTNPHDRGNATLYVTFFALKRAILFIYFYSHKPR